MRGALVLAVVLFGLAGCGSAERHEESVASPSAAHIAETEHEEAEQKKKKAAETAEHYSGLGSKSAAFSAENPGKPSPNPPAGNTWYTILSTDSAGRVTAYQMEENDEPALEPRERVGTLGGTSLPSDARETNLNGVECIVWRSATLKRLIGDEYAAATTSPNTASAEMRAESSPSCHGASAREPTAEE
jgi:hypothetical protein